MSKKAIFSDLICDYGLERDSCGEDSFSEREFGKIKVEYLRVRSEKYKNMLNAEAGDYVSVHFGDISTMDPTVENSLISSIALELKALYPQGIKRLLVAGIGSSELVADSVGYRTVKELNACDKNGLFCFHADVSESTGIESAELIRSVAEAVDASAVIVVDSVVTRGCERLSRTVQLSNAGLSPGRGLGAVKKRVDGESISRPVISVGVPTVIDLRSLGGGDVKGTGGSNGERVFLTAHSIDLAVRRFAYVIARAIEKSLL